MNDLEEGTELRIDFAKLLKATTACPEIVPPSGSVWGGRSRRAVLLRSGVGTSASM